MMSQMRREQREYETELLHGHVSSAENIHDLVSILQCIPLTKVQDMIHAHIDELDGTETKHTLCQSISIENILPECIIQYTLSFIHLNLGKLVNTKWKQYSEKNEEIFIKKQLESIINDEYDPDWDNKILVVHPSRKKLYEWEEELGWKGPINTFNINEAITNCESGDIILFHNGKYTHSSQRAIEIDINIHLIGIGDNVVFKDNGIGSDEYQRSFLEIAGGRSFDDHALNTINSVYIENIKFDCNVLYAVDENVEYLPIGHIFVEELTKLFMKNCILLGTGCTAENGIVTSYESCLEVNNCEFISYNNGIAIAISDHTESVSVTGCVFRNCGAPIKCVTVVRSGYIADMIAESYQHKSVKMTLNENLFMENS